MVQQGIACHSTAWHSIHNVVQGVCSYLHTQPHILLAVCWQYRHMTKSAFAFDVNTNASALVQTSHDLD